ncbi:AbgT family transporter [Gilvimarinus sp. DA14]|uniref:AbgT family transporter n=1 Tax=Gilvimarinus sp. DA14 TaxID=2956798 RepID=UPI0020B8E2A8|nr:AbgT family transporter [Gilvimarinus sp. DA14]UTF61185.1 AbgT family transporter [Gilvimarinus sp. DA14]
MTAPMENSFWVRRLSALEKLGNRLPQPVVLFIALAVLIALASTLAHWLQWQARVPGSGEVLSARSVLSVEGIRWALTSAVDNFTGFAPVGAVLVTMLGLGVAERAGLLQALLLRLVMAVHPRYLSFAVVLAGILSNLAFDVGYVLLIPLAGVLFQVAGRPPLAGIAACFAGVSAGYSANFLLGPADVILAGLSSEALQLVKPQAQVSVAANYYFAAASTVVLALTGMWVTERVVSPYLRGQPVESGTQDAPPAPHPKGLRWVLVYSLVFALIVLGVALPDGAPLRTEQGFALQALVPLIALYAAGAGWVYGKVSGSFKQPGAATEGMEQAMASLAGYLVLMFFAAQAVAWFGWSGLGQLLAATGANWLVGFDGQVLLLLLLFILISAFINLFVGSASAKWGLLAPVFVPMLLLLGVAPEQTQMAYRIGDSVTNIITPLMPYFGVVLAFAARYRPKIGVGTLIAMMLPYSLAFLLVWTAMFTLWLLLGWPLGF